jgi:hypothetical protein
VAGDIASMTNIAHTVKDIADVRVTRPLERAPLPDHWTSDFDATLRRNLRNGKKEVNEGAFTSALVHTRSLLEFYARVALPTG